MIKRFERLPMHRVWRGGSIDDRRKQVCYKISQNGCDIRFEDVKIVMISLVLNWSQMLVEDQQVRGRR